MEKNLKEILELAISFEISARDFYTDLIPKASKNLRYLEELAEEEQKHFDLFTKLSQTIETFLCHEEIIKHWNYICLPFYIRFCLLGLVRCTHNKRPG
jgi:hypothetical protein